MEKFPLTAEQAISMLPDGDSIHTYRFAHFGVLIGADWSREKLVEAINDHKCEIGGDQCKAVNHGLVVHIGDDPLFVECKKGFDYEEFERANGPEAVSGEA